MKTLLYLAVRLYPARWRERYGVEYRALLEQTSPTLRNVMNVAVGGLGMRVNTASPSLMALAFGGMGLVLAGAGAYVTSHRVESAGTLRIDSTGTAPAKAADDLDAELLALAAHALNDDYLATLVDRTDVRGSRHTDARTGPRRVSDVRGDLSVALISPSVLRVSYASDSPAHAQGIATELMRHLIDVGLQDAIEAKQSQQPREPRTLQILDPVGSPQRRVSPRRMAVAGTWGLGFGVLAGVLVGGIRRHRRAPN